MSAQPINDADWQRLSWNKRARLVDELAKRARIIRAELDTMLAERNDLEQALHRLRGDVTAEIETLDLRARRPGLRIIWPTDSHWSADELKTAHAAYARGERDDWTVTGHRIWDKQRRRQQRKTEDPARRARNAAAMRERRAQQRQEHAA